jgi:CBS domain-containing protein
METVQEVMTANPTALSATMTIGDAARMMRDHDIGDVMVLDEENRLCGIVTDRDIVVRAVAADKDPTEVHLGDICSRVLTTIDADASLKDAVKLMREHALRRLPVVDHGRPAGIVSLGDLAVERDPGSALAAISAAPANT